MIAVRRQLPLRGIGGDLLRRLLWVCVILAVGWVAPAGGLTAAAGWLVLPFCPGCTWPRGRAAAAAGHMVTNGEGGRAGCGREATGWGAASPGPTPKPGRERVQAAAELAPKRGGRGRVWSPGPWSERVKPGGSAMATYPGAGKVDARRTLVQLIRWYPSQRKAPAWTLPGRNSWARPLPVAGQWAGLRSAPASVIPRWQTLLPTLDGGRERC